MIAATMEAQTVGCPKKQAPSKGGTKKTKQ
jgi:hypothetical protein